MALNANENILYVAETLTNRILRVILCETGVYHTSVFHQFSGRFGPTALAVSPEGKLYVARYDFKEGSQNGIISIITPEGEVEEELVLNEHPNLTGLYFSKVQDDILYATTETDLLKIQVNGE